MVNTHAARMTETMHTGNENEESINDWDLILSKHTKELNFVNIRDLFDNEIELVSIHS